MKLVKKLAHLEKAGIWAINRATKTLPKAKSSPSDRESLFSSITINTLNTWAIFSRTYFTACLLGAKTSSGKSITSSESMNHLQPNDAIGHAVKSFKANATPLSTGLWNSRDEPAWHDSGNLIYLATKFNFSNLTDIQTAFTYGFTAHKDLVVFRNYYAHRNRGTRKRAQDVATKYAIPSHLHPTDILLTCPLSTPGVTLIDQWRSELTQTISLLCS